MFEKTNHLLHGFHVPIPLQVLLIDKAYHLIPKETGVYMILCNSSESANFLENSVVTSYISANLVLEYQKEHCILELRNT